ncbi:MAG: hypothetical protein KIS29_08115 [Thermoplasmata archaeon]|jgi:hypothetical protein|nr:hypothetical protein [Candidatus Sysuiplasma jiujiangense]
MKGIAGYSNEQLCSGGNSDAPERRKIVDRVSLSRMVGLPVSVRIQSMAI